QRGDPSRDPSGHASFLGLVARRGKKSAKRRSMSPDDGREEEFDAVAAAAELEASLAREKGGEAGGADAYVRMLESEVETLNALVDKHQGELERARAEAERARAE